MRMKILVGIGLIAVGIVGAGAPAFAGSNSSRTGGSSSVAGPMDVVASSALTNRTFPARVRADLDRAYQIASARRARRGSTLTTRVRLCVAPSGVVSQVALISGSGVGAFDKALVDTMRGWTYAAYAAPAGIRVCDDLKIIYRHR